MNTWIWQVKQILLPLMQRRELKYEYMDLAGETDTVASHAEA